jgi:hypothetical protein
VRETLLKLRGELKRPVMVKARAIRTRPANAR